MQPEAIGLEMRVSWHRSWCANDFEAWLLNGLQAPISNLPDIAIWIPLDNEFHITGPLIRTCSDSLNSCVSLLDAPL